MTERSKKHLAQTVAIAVGDMVVRRHEVVDADGGSYHDYILRRHWPTTPRASKSSASGVRVQQTSTAITRARTEHEKRGGAPVPETVVAAPIKVGSTAARAQHNRLGGAPLPPLKKRR